MEEKDTGTTLMALIIGGLVALVIALFAFGGLPGQKLSPTSALAAPNIQPPR